MSSVPGPERVIGESLDKGEFPTEAWRFSAGVLALDRRLSAPAVSISSTAVIPWLVPAGSVIPYAGRTTPLGWLSCGGQAVSRTTYATLFTAVSTTWGAGNGSTTFNVPDLRGVGLRGAGTNGSRSNAAGVSYTGLSVGSAIADQMQGHWQDWAYGTSPGGTTIRITGQALTSASQTNRATDQVRSPSSDGVNGTPRTGAETRGATSSVLFIIKT